MTPNPEQSERLLALVKGLAKGSRKALLAMTDEWQFAGAKSFNAAGAHALESYCRDLAEHEFRKPGPRTQYARPAWRLTPLGLALRDHLRARAGDGA